jgi:type IX secretion system PorP/SprF family membrane protein
MGGINFDVNEQVKLKPAVLLKAVSGAPTAIDVSLNAQFNKLFTVGVAYRSQAAINALFDLRVTSNVNIGYSYGYETSTVSNFSSGSHEILLRWRVGNLVSGLQQPTWLY